MIFCYSNKRYSVTILSYYWYFKKRIWRKAKTWYKHRCYLAKIFLKLSKFPKKCLSKCRWEGNIRISVSVFSPIIHYNAQITYYLWFLLKYLDRFSLHNLLQQETEEKIASWNAFIWKVSVKLIPLEVTKIKGGDWLEILFTKRIKRFLCNVYYYALTQIQRTWTSFWVSGVSKYFWISYIIFYSTKSIARKLIIIMKQWISTLRLRIP